MKTPLFESHLESGARMVEFAGWTMPVEYSGLRYEHLTVREKVGLFDVSHMGEIRFRGPKSLESLEWLTTNQVSKLTAGEAQYSLLPNLNGGLVDDIIVYCVQPGEDYLVCVNASNTEKDFGWMREHNRGAEILNESAEWGQIAVQGPLSDELLSKIWGKDVAALKSFHWRPLRFEKMEVLVARTGYTGERGVEIFVPAPVTRPLWNLLLERGADLGIKPIGLGARDTLRTEMKYSLYGHEIDDTTNPYAAGLGWVVKASEKDFLGKAAMVEGKARAQLQKLVGFKMLDRGIPRSGYPLLNTEKNAMGRVTSGTLSPTLNESIGIGYVSQALASPGSEIFVEIRGRHVPARVVKTPFIQPKSCN